MLSWQLTADVRCLVIESKFNRMMVLVSCVWLNVRRTYHHFINDS